MTAPRKIELVPVPDVDRAKAFYQQLGFTADHDHRVPGGLRFVQLTPPGPACSSSPASPEPPGAQCG